MGVEPDDAQQALTLASGVAQALATDLSEISGELTRLSEVDALQTESLLRVAAAMEAARSIRRGADELCALLGEAALSRGATPGLLDWADPRET